MDINIPMDQLPYPQTQADLAKLVMMALAGDPRAMQLLYRIWQRMMWERQQQPRDPNAPIRQGRGYVASKPKPTKEQCADDNWLADHPEAQQQCLNPQAESPWKPPTVVTQGPFENMLDKAESTGPYLKMPATSEAVGPLEPDKQSPAYQLLALLGSFNEGGT